MTSSLNLAGTMPSATLSTSVTNTSLATGSVVVNLPARVLHAADPDNLTDSQVAVLRAFYEFGQAMDDVALAVYVHHVNDEPMSSSSIRSRRAELSRGPKPLIQAVDTKRLHSGRRAAVHGLTSEGVVVAERLFS